MNVVLIGFMCSGKSRVGRMLAKALGWPHIDTDDEVFKETGMTAGDCIRQRGEAAFRELEAKIVSRVSQLDHHVISTGGGVPVNPANRAALSQKGLVIWLRILPQTALRRAGDIAKRPLIDPADPDGSIRQRMAEREPAYSTAHLILQTDHRSPQQTVDAIVCLTGVRPK